MSELLGKPVVFAADTVGAAADEAVAGLNNSDIALLENLRFSPNETSHHAHERAAFADELARYGSAFVSDGFGVMHRKQASVYELAELLPSAAGQLVVEEIQVME